jgi:hypothetical protein
MPKSETEKLAATANGCLTFIAICLVVLVAGCVVGPGLPLLLVGGAGGAP